MSTPGEDLRKYLLIPKSRNIASNPAAVSSSHTLKRKAKATTMEIDSPSSEPGGLDTTGPVLTQIDGVLSMDEFESAFTAQHEASKAGKPAPAPAKVAKSKAKAGPQLGAGPIAIGARTSKYTIALHDKYQKLGVPQPQFTFEGSSDRGWSGRVSFPGLHEELQGIKDDGRVHSSKQEAKEELSQRALEILERLEKEGAVKKVEVHSARVSKHTVALHDKCQKLGITQPFFTYDGSTEKGWSAAVTFPGLDEIQDMKDENYHQNKSEAKEALCKQVLLAVETAEQQGHFERFGKAKGPAQQAHQEKPEPGPNYIGQLLEFQRAAKSPQPTYSDYAIGTSFTCLVNIEGVGTFGSLDNRYTSKKTARRQAARAAVEHFKAAGLWPEDVTEVGGIKKKKLNRDGVPQLIASPKADEDSSRAASMSSSISTTGSYPQQVARLAHILSLGTPEWRYTPSPMDPDFHTVHCFFAGGGAHAGPIGEVRNVLGKKKAKEECARLTLEYLNEVYAQRIAYGQRMVEGITGGEDVLEGAVGRSKEAGAEAVQARRQFVTEIGGQESSDELEFQDAMEDVTV